MIYKGPRIILFQGIQTHIGLSSGLFQMFYCFECGDFAEVFDDLFIISQVRIFIQLNLYNSKILGFRSYTYIPIFELQIKWKLIHMPSVYSQT